MVEVVEAGDGAGPDDERYRAMSAGGGEVLGDRAQWREPGSPGDEKQVTVGVAIRTSEARP